MDALLKYLRPEFAELSSYVPENPPGIRVRLDANEAPPSRSAAVRDAVLRAVAGVALERYPDARAMELKEQLALRCGATPSELLVGTGSDEVISLILNGLARPRDGRPAPTVLFPTPTFVMYRITARAHGWNAVGVPLDASWDLDVPAMLEAIEREAPSLIFIASPNNPTGNAMSEERIVAILNAAPTSFVIVDEAYGDFAGRSLRHLRGRYPHLGILRTLSKVGLASLRVGWLEAHEDLVRELDKGRQPFNVSALSQAAATAVLRDAWTDVTREVNAILSERARVAEALRGMAQVSLTDSRANFHWVRTEREARAVFDALAKRGILVRNFAKGGDRLSHQLRITVGAPDENDELLEAIAACLP